MLTFIRRHREEKQKKKQLERDQLTAAYQKKAENAKKQILELAEQYLQSEIDDLLQRTPKPFQPGDQVVFDYYTKESHSRGSFWTTPYDFINAFQDVHNLGGPMLFTVKDCFVESRLSDAFDFNHTYGAKALLEKVISGNLLNYSLHDTFRQYWFTLKGNSRVADWMVKLDWEKANIPYLGSSKGYVSLNWGKGDFIWHSLIPANSQDAKDQILLWEEKKRLDIAKEKLAAASEEYLENVEQYQKMKRSKQFGAHYNSLADFLSGKRNLIK